MSARSNPACAILSSGRLAVIGGDRGPSTYFRMDTCLTFTIRHSCAPAKISGCLASGTHDVFGHFADTFEFKSQSEETLHMAGRVS